MTYDRNGMIELLRKDVNPKGLKAYWDFIRKNNGPSGGWTLEESNEFHDPVRQIAWVSAWLDGKGSGEKRWPTEELFRIELDGLNIKLDRIDEIEAKHKRLDDEEFRIRIDLLKNVTRSYVGHDEKFWSKRYMSK